MNNMSKVRDMLVTSGNGVITTKQVTAVGIHRATLPELANRGEVYRYGRGLYIRSDAWEDDMYMLQQRYGKGIYSYGTALYLFGYTDTTPVRYTMTFPQGYNAHSLSDEGLIVKRAVPDNYLLGITEVKSPCGNPLRIYCLERTLCDIVRGQGCDIRTVNDAMKMYAADKNRDMNKLIYYAEKLHVVPKITRYMEVLL